MPDYRLRIIVEGQDNASRPLGNVASSLQRIGEFAAGGLLARGIESVGRGIVGAGRQALSAYADFERLQLSLETLVAREELNTGAAETMNEALAASGEKTQELIKWVEDLAVLSPFNQKDIADSFRLTMAYGFTADEAQRLTTVMTDFAAGSGATGDVMNRIALALGQIKARGKLAGQEIMQLTEAGIPVRQILAEAFGVTTAQLEEMQRKGIDANRAIEAIVSSLERDFAGAAERQAGTFSGLISSLEDLREIGLRDFFGPMFQQAQPYLEAFVDTITDPEVRTAITSVGEAIGTKLGGALTTVSGALKNFSSSYEAASNQLGKTEGVLGAIVKMLGGDYSVELETVFAENPPPLPEDWAGQLDPLDLTTKFPLAAPPLPDSFGASMDPVEVTAKVGKTVTGGPISVSGLITETEVAPTATPGDVIMSGVVQTISLGAVDFVRSSEGAGLQWGENNELLFQGAITTLTMGANSLTFGDEYAFTWNEGQNSFEFDGVVASLVIGDNAFSLGGESGASVNGVTWADGKFKFLGEISLALSEFAEGSIVQKLFTPGSLSDTEIAVTVKTSLTQTTAGAIGIVKKLFSPASLSDTAVALTINSSVENITEGAKAFIENMFTPGSLSDTSFAVTVNTQIADLTTGAKAFIDKMLEPDGLADKTTSVNIVTSISGAGQAILTWLGIGGEGDEEATAGTASVKMSISDEANIVQQFKQAVAQLAVNLWAGAEGFKQKIEESSLFNLGPDFWPSIPSLDTNFWPEFPTWEWPPAANGLLELLGWKWPSKSGGLADLIKWKWPQSSGGLSKLLSWDWPDFGMPGWVSSLLAALGALNLGGGSGSANGGQGMMQDPGNNTGSNRFTPKYALGTRYWRGGMALVGEFGPEMVTLPQGSAIHTAPQTARMLSAVPAGNVTIQNVHVHNDMDVNRMAYRVADIIQRRGRGAV